MIQYPRFTENFVSHTAPQKKRKIMAEYRDEEDVPAKRARSSYNNNNEDTISRETISKNRHICKILMDVCRQQCVFSLARKVANEHNKTQLSNMLDLTMKSWNTSLGNLRKMDVSSNVSNKQKVIRAHIENSLKFRGFCVLDKFVGSEIGKKIDCEMNDLKLTNRFRNEGNSVAKNGRSRDRSDEVCWVTGNETGCEAIKELMEFCDTIIGHGDDIDGKAIPLSTNAMLSIHPGNSSRHHMHVDNGHNDGRYLTCTYFPNKDWNSENGGEVHLLARTCGRSAVINPIMDRVIFYYSDRRNPHEILPTINVNRKSVTFWYYDYNERMLALESLKTQLSNSSPKQNVNAQ